MHWSYHSFALSHYYLLSRIIKWDGSYQEQHFYRADSRFAPSQWETALHCNNVSHWLGASLESALFLHPIKLLQVYISDNTVCWLDCSSHISVIFSLFLPPKTSLNHHILSMLSAFGYHQLLYNHYHVIILVNSVPGGVDISDKFYQCLKTSRETDFQGHISFFNFFMYQTYFIHQNFNKVVVYLI